MAQKTKVIVSAENQTAQAFKAVEGSLENLKRVGEAVGIGLSVGAFVEMIKKSAELVESLDRVAERTGMTVEQLAKMRAAAKLTHVEWDTLQNSLKFFARNAQAAAQGTTAMQDSTEGGAEATGKAAKAFELLAIKVTDTNGRVRPMNDLLEEAFRKLEEMPDGITKTATTMAIFGKSGDQLIPLINHFQEVKGKAEELAKVFSGLGAVELSRLAETMKEFEARSEAAKLQFSAGIAPSLNRIVQSITEARDGMSGLEVAGQRFGRLLETLVFGSQSISYALQKGALAVAKGQFETEFPGADTSTFDKRMAELENKFSEKWIAYNAQNPVVPPAHRPSGGAGPAITNDAKVNAAKKTNEARARFEEQANEQIAHSAEAFRKSELAELETQKTQGLVILDDYFRRRREISEEGYLAELKALMDKQQAAKDLAAKSVAGSPEQLKALADVEKFQSELTKKAGERADADQRYTAEEFEQRRQLRDFLLATEAEIQVAKGNTAATALDGIRREFEEKRRTMKALGKDTGGLDNLEAQRTAAAQAEDLARQIDLVQQRLATNIERITSAEQSQAVTATAGEREINQLRADAARQLDGMIQKYEQLALASGNPQLIENVNRLRLAHQQLGLQISWVRDQAVNGLTNSFEGLFAGIISDAPNAAAAFASFGKSILQMISQIISKMIAMYIVQQMIGLVFPSLAGAAGGASAAGSSMAAGGLGGISFAASGAHASAGQPFIVGEQGMELFVPDQPGTIVPHGKLGAMGRSGDTYYIDAKGADQAEFARLRTLIYQLHGDAIQKSVQLVNEMGARK